MRSIMNQKFVTNQENISELHKHIFFKNSIPCQILWYALTCKKQNKHTPNISFKDYKIMIKDIKCDGKS